MRDKLLNFLTVGLITLVVISPGLIVFTVIWERHLELVSAQNYSYNLHNSNIGWGSNSYGLEGTNSSKINAIVTSGFLVGEYRITKILLWLLLFAPISLSIGIFGYEKYLIHRQKMLEKQIQMLERMWLLTIDR